MSRLGALTVAVLSVATLLLATLPVAAATRWQGPEVISGFKDGPVHVFSPNSYQRVATLPVPTGRWVAWAKLFVTTDGWNGALVVKCKLGSSGGPAHVGTVQVEEDAPAPTKQSLALSTWASFGRGGGKLIVSCRGAAAANWIKIMAMRVGTLTTVDIGGRANVTTGSGKPAVVLGSRNRSVRIPEESAKTVATMSLGAGAWSVRTSFTVVESGSPRATCSLKIGSAVRDSARVMWNLGHTVVELESAVSLSRSQSVKIACAVESGAGGGGEYINAGNLRITAVKLGTLVTFNSRGNQVTHGSGLPKAYFRTAPKHVLTNGSWSDVASLNLEAGRWMVFSRAQLASAQENPWYRWGNLQCQLVASPDYDQSPIEGWETPGLPLAVVHQFDARGPARLRCRADNADPVNPSAIDSIRVTAFKLGSLVNVAL